MHNFGLEIVLKFSFISLQYASLEYGGNYNKCNVQVLCHVIPSLVKLRKEGLDGHEKIKSYMCVYLLISSRETCPHEFVAVYIIVNIAYNLL